MRMGTPEELGYAIATVADEKNGYLAGVDVKAFSRATGIAESTICDWKKKGFTPKTDKLNAICTALDISVEKLLFGKEGTIVEKKPDDFTIISL